MANKKQGENWHIGEHVLEIVDQFTNLGIVFNYMYNNNFTNAEKQLSEKGRKALFALKRNIRNMCLNHTTQLSLFDCYIGGVVNYASEIWGTQKGQNVENLHLIFVNNCWV